MNSNNYSVILAPKSNEFTHNIFYGSNKNTGHHILLDRRSLITGTGILLGTPRSGIETAIKHELWNVLAYLKDDVILIDQTGEYHSFFSSFDVDYINITDRKNTEFHINPLDIYSFSPFDKIPSKRKVDFLAAISESLLYCPLSDRMLRIIERGSEYIYEKFEDSYNKETHQFDSSLIPTLKDFQTYLQNQVGYDAYVLSGAVNDFNFEAFSSQTNVSQHKHFTIFDISCIPEKFRSAAYLCTLEYVWNRMIHNRKSSKHVWLYLNGVNDLFHSNYCSHYLHLLSKQCRSENCILTLITENVSDVIKDVYFRDALASNSFIQLFHVEQSVSNELTSIFNLSDKEMQPVINAPTGNGLLLIDGKPIPFSIPFRI